MLDWLESSFLLFPRLEGLGASRLLFMPSHEPKMYAMSQESMRRPLDQFLVPKIKPHGIANFNALPTSVLENLYWEHVPLSLKWRCRQRWIPFPFLYSYSDCCTH